jgi:radical SAM protein with 4Fe4S-binding SPASM domain
MTTSFVGIPVKEGNLLQIWQRSALFTRIRAKLLAPNCTGCSHSSVCMGGCPVFKNINVCGPAPRSHGHDLVRPA